MPPIALIVTDTKRSRLGHRARLGDVLGDANVLTHTLRRAATLSGVSRLVLVHPAGQAAAVAGLIAAERFDKPVQLFETPSEMMPTSDARWVAARRWAPTAWRGGLGGATAFDEVLPAAPLVAAMDEHNAESAVLLRAEWCLFEPAYAEGQLARHCEDPAAYKLTFSQAPPGLSCVVAHREALERLVSSQGSFGTGLTYQPRRPQGDPIGRDLNHAIPHTVRDMNRRFVYDTPRSVDLIRAIADQLGDDFASASAVTVTDAARAIEAEQRDWRWRRLPQQVALELTPSRAVAGPITPRHYVTFDRPNLDAGLAQRIVSQLGDEQTAGDVALRLGGIGDALLHPQWDEIIIAAHEAGVMSIGVDTDLLCDEATLDRLHELPIDLLTVRLNADRAATYEAVMGEARFKQVTDNLQYLFDARRQRLDEGKSAVRWIVPRMVKTAETLPDMESFFDRWMMVEGHAIIEPAQSGCGLMPEQSPVVMTPPRREACRQLGGRMTILSDGRVALCDQDWQGQAAVGEAQTTPLLELWRRLAEPAEQHAAGRFEVLDPCSRCREWHRP
ncbi:SPASM domain-containing protein [Phycisphaerales bacterium AB-hyl4]|uniref:SPASM domain-containing protein n=1 Tax=Natronomicrosphaera hydrolytica TaxID=3242702 RepID=A0ABV4U0X3_9BACT